MRTISPAIGQNGTTANNVALFECHCILRWPAPSHTANAAHVGAPPTWELRPQVVCRTPGGCAADHFSGLDVHLFHPLSDAFLAA
jgi:hypothetical protein